MVAVMVGVGPALWSCAPLHYSPVAACPALADGTHPSTGPLEVLPSEVPGVQLDSMSWAVHTGRDPEAFDTWIGMSAVGRMVSTKEVSLVGVGVLIEGMRDDVVVHGMIDSSFRELRQVPGIPAEYIDRETVRPDRPVPVGVGEKASGDSPPERWGCPARARIVRLSPPGAVLRPPRPPADERPSSIFYAWNPWTFSVDTVMRGGGSRSRCFAGRGDTARTDVILVRSKILYRRFEPRYSGGLVVGQRRRTRRARRPARLGRGPCEVVGGRARSVYRDTNPEPGRNDPHVQIRGPALRVALSHGEPAAGSRPDRSDDLAHR